VLSHWSKECYNIPKLMAAPYGEASSAEKPRLWERTANEKKGAPDAKSSRERAL
jgi:hypothetical protein